MNSRDIQELELTGFGWWASEIFEGEEDVNLALSSSETWGLHQGRAYERMNKAWGLDDACT